MTCAEARDRLDDYVDGTLAEAEFQEMELHLAGCPECREEERLLRSLLAQAASLPHEVQPARDLWPGIAARISRPRKVVPFFRRWNAGVLAAAAAAAVAVASAVSVSRSTGPAGGPSPVTPDASMLPAASGGAGLEQAEAEYARAAAALIGALEANRASLPPEVLASVEENLRSIDTALDEVRGALRKDPGNRQLAYMLASTHQKKVDVLRRVVRLSTRL